MRPAHGALRQIVLRKQTYRLNHFRSNTCNMAPSAIPVEHIDGIEVKKLAQTREPLKSSGSLDQYQTVDITPVIGTEFPDANLVEWINAPNAGELLRDLAIKSKPIRAYLKVKANSLNLKSLSAGSFSSEHRIT